MNFLALNLSHHSTFFHSVLFSTNTAESRRQLLTKYKNKHRAWIDYSMDVLDLVVLWISTSEVMLAESGEDTRSFCWAVSLDGDHNVGGGQSHHGSLRLPRAVIWEMHWWDKQHLVSRKAKWKMICLLFSHVCHWFLTFKMVVVLKMVLLHNCVWVTALELKWSVHKHVSGLQELEDSCWRFSCYELFYTSRACLGCGDCLNIIMKQSERQLSSYWQMVVCIGWGFWLVDGGRRRCWGRWGRGQWRHSWWDPHFNQLLLPLVFSSFSFCTIIPLFSLPCSPADPTQVFQAFCSATMQRGPYDEEPLLY